MRLGLVQTLLVLSARIGCRCTDAEDVGHGSDDMQHVMGQHEDIHQKTFQSERPHVPFAGDVPMTRNELIAIVQKDYADPLPIEIYVRQVLEGVHGVLNWWGKSAPLSWLFEVNVRVPWMASCKPVIRGVKRLAQGISCPGGTGCSVAVTFRVAESYQITQGLQIETSVGFGVGYKGVEASVSSSIARSWEKTWSNSNETEVQYTWHLGPSQRCIPSMAHVELECDVDYETVWYDSYFRKPKDFTDLEFRYNRKGGQFDAGQWCFKQTVSSTPLQRKDDWHEVLPKDGFSGSRGDIWKRPPTEMNQYRTGSGARRFENKDIILRRQRGSGGNMQEVFGCKRNPRSRQSAKITIPLSSEFGALEGYIGCVV